MYPPPPEKLHDFIGGGTSFVVTFLPPDRVLKRAHDDVFRDAEHERKIFAILGPHPRIVQCFGTWNDWDKTVVLAYHRRGCLRQVLSEFSADANGAHADTVNMQQRRRRWAVQVAEGLAYMHTRNIVHGDVNASKVLVTDDDNVVLCDFVGSCVDGEAAFAPCFEQRHYRPREKHEELMRFVQDDVFAFGSLLYELYTHKKPYADKSDQEVDKLYREGSFPDVSNIPVGPIITSCWTSRYKRMDDVLYDFSVPPTYTGLSIQHYFRIPWFLFDPVTSCRWFLYLKALWVGETGCSSLGIVCW